jgi:hypothetical protein
MNLTEEKALQITREFIKGKRYEKVGQPRFAPAGSPSGDKTNDTWVVPVKYELFGLEETDYVSVNDSDGVVLYVTTAHGYLYGAPKGSESLRRDNKDDSDDGDDWDDL